MRRVWRPLLAVVSLAGVSAAWLLRPEHRPPPPEAQAASGLPDRLPADTRAEAVALQSLRARQRDPEAVMFREVRVWRFGPEGERAVCGVVESRELPGGSAPFVVRVVLPSGSGAPSVPGRPQSPAAAASAMPILEDGPGMNRPAPEARRRFCRDGAAEPPPPVPARDATSATLPPAAGAGAGALPTAVVSPPAPASPSVAGTGQPSGERVTVASHANLRGGPMGGEPVLSVVPRGTVLSVFGRAPGGWVRVGEGEPWGWIHGSMLSEAPPPVPAVAGR